MRKWILLGINIAPLILFMIFFRFGANVGDCMIPLQFGIFIWNCKYTKNKKEFLLYSILFLLSSVLGIVINGLLYFQFICYDTEGVLVLELEIIVAAVYLAVLTLIGLVIKQLTMKRRAKK